MPRHTSPSTTLLSARDAAQALGISLDTLRRWDRNGTIATVRDARNRRLVPEAEVRRLAQARRTRPPATSGSARNRLRGVVRSMQVDGLLARVELETTEPARLVAVVTREAVEELGLRAGHGATAVVKATSMMLEVEEHSA